jgi:RimJ/RimL family protein N-acetyltransferase
MSATAPVIETARLRLRAHRDDDLPDMVAMWSDPQVVRFIGGRPFTLEETTARLAHYRAMWASHGHGFWAVEDRATGDFVGEMGLARFDRSLGPAFDDWPEAGWVLAPSAWGRGIATEGVAAVLDWADAGLRAERIVCMIAEGHAVSIRVAARFGFTPWRDAVFGGSPMVLMERARPTVSG